MSTNEKIAKNISRNDGGALARCAAADGITQEELIAKVRRISSGKMVRTHQ